MGEAPYIGLLFVLGDSPGDKLLQGSENFLNYIDGFAEQLANPLKMEGYCIKFLSASAAYHSFYGVDALPDSYRQLGKAVCNFNESGRITDSAVIKAEFRQALAKNNAGHSVQQFLGSILSVLESNDPASFRAPFVKDNNGNYPALYIVATMGIAADNTPAEVFDEASQAFLPDINLRGPVLQQALAHPLNEPDTQWYYDFQNLEAGTPVCDRSRSLVDPLCVCDIVGPMCMYWLYRNQYPLMTAQQFKSRLTQYIEKISGTEEPNVIMATVGVQSIVETMAYFSAAYLSAPNYRMHQFVKAFNQGQTDANAVCASHGGLENSCSWNLGAGGAQNIFDVARAIGENSIKPVVLTLPIDNTKPMTVTLSTGAGLPRVLGSQDYSLQGRKIVFSEAIKTEIQQARVGTSSSIRVMATVEYTPAPNKGL